MTELVMRQFELPSVRATVRRIIDELIEGKSVCVLLPSTIPAQLVREELKSALDRRRVEDHEYWSPPRDNDPPSCQLFQAFCPGQLYPDPLRVLLELLRYPRELSGNCELAGLPQILFLCGIDELSPAVQATWLSFLDAWQSAIKANSDQNRRPCSYCIVADSSKLVSSPPSDVWLSTVYWWNIPSELELQILCRDSEAQRCISYQERWRESLLPVLAGGDISLLAALMEVEPIMIDQCEPILQKHADRHSWLTCSDRGVLRQLNLLVPHLGGQSPSSPPEHLHDLWASGVILHSPERGLHVHPGFLCVRNRQWLSFFDWHAQQQALFGVMEQLRFSLCSEMTQTLGEGWALSPPPEDLNERERVQLSSTHCGWSHFQAVLRKRPEVRNLSDWIGVLRQAPLLRNRLAHSVTSNVADITNFLLDVGKVLQTRRASARPLVRIAGGG